MNPRHQVSRAAIDMIKRFEGYRRKAARLPDGRWTLGYGHTQTARAGAQVSEDDAEALLLWDLIGVIHAINEHTFTPLNRNQFDALCSFVFNIGAENYRHSAVLRRLNEGQMLQAAACMEMWRKADVGAERIVIDALVRRRAAEKLLFLTPIDGWMPAPTPVLPPKLDLDAIEGLSLETPISLSVSLDGPSAVAEPSPPEGATASERASTAVSARLQRILTGPDPIAGPSLRLTPATEYDFDPDPEPEVEVAERQNGPTLFEVAPPEPATLPMEANPAQRMVLQGISGAPHQPTWLGPFAPIALTAGGMALSGGSLGWAFYANGAAGPLDPLAVSWVGGLAGVSMMAFAAYLALRRLGESNDDES
ncbi:MAG TPA: glycoside hydrolase family protein [Caulobacteraceae bacterium]